MFVRVDQRLRDPQVVTLVSDGLICKGQFVIGVVGKHISDRSNLGKVVTYLRTDPFERASLIRAEKAPIGPVLERSSSLELRRRR